MVAPDLGKRVAARKEYSLVSAHYFFGAWHEGLATLSELKDSLGLSTPLAPNSGQ